MIKCREIIFFALICLAGCASKPVTPEPPVLIAKDQTINIEPSLLKKATPLKKLNKTSYTQGESVEDAVKPWANQYTECMLHLNALIDITSKAFNVSKTETSSK